MLTVRPISGHARSLFSVELFASQRDTSATTARFSRSS